MTLIKKYCLRENLCLIFSEKLLKVVIMLQKKSKTITKKKLRRYFIFSMLSY